MTRKPNGRPSQWEPSSHGSDTGGMQRRVARGLTWTVIDTWGSQMIGLVIFVLLARLLTEDDFGLLVMAAIFVAFVQLFVDQGLGDAVVQRSTLTRRQLDTAFWASMVTGLILTVASILLAGPISALLGDRRLEPIIQVLSLTFLLTALSSIQLDLLRREMAFRSLAIRRLTAVLISGIVGVAMAIGGFGAWSLVGQQITAALVSVVMLWAVTPWRPSLQFSRKDFGELFGFGIRVVGGDMLNFLSRNVDRLLIGIFLGVIPVALYGVAYRILDTSQTLLINSARKLLFPTFSRLQHDPDRIRRAYLRMNRVSSILTLSGYVGLALVAQEATVVVFSAKWADSGPVAAILFLIGPVLTVQAYSGALFNAVGHPEVTLRFRLITTVTNIVGFLIAVLVFRDILAVAAAFVVRGYLLLPLNLVWMSRYGGIPLREHLMELKGVAAATLVMAVCVLLVKVALLGQVSAAVLLLAEVLVGAAVLAVALLVLERPLVAEIAAVAGQAVPGAGRVGRLIRPDTQLDPTGLADEDDEQDRLV